MDALRKISSGGSSLGVRDSTPRSWTDFRTSGTSSILGDNTSSLRDFSSSFNLKPSYPPPPMERSWESQNHKPVDIDSFSIRSKEWSARSNGSNDSGIGSVRSAFATLGGSRDDPPGGLDSVHARLEGIRTSLFSASTELDRPAVPQASTAASNSTLDFLDRLRPSLPPSSPSTPSNATLNLDTLGSLRTAPTSASNVLRKASSPFSRPQSTILTTPTPTLSGAPSRSSSVGRGLTHSSIAGSIAGDSDLDSNSGKQTFGLSGLTGVLDSSLGFRSASTDQPRFQGETMRLQGSEDSRDESHAFEIPGSVQSRKKLSRLFDTLSSNQQQDSEAGGGQKEARSESERPLAVPEAPASPSVAAEHSRVPVASPVASPMTSILSHAPVDKKFENIAGDISIAQGLEPPAWWESASKQLVRELEARMEKLVMPIKQELRDIKEEMKTSQVTGGDKNALAVQKTKSSTGSTGGLDDAIDKDSREINKKVERLQSMVDEQGSNVKECLRLLCRSMQDGSLGQEGSPVHGKKMSLPLTPETSDVWSKLDWSANNPKDLVICKREHASTAFEQLPSSKINMEVLTLSELRVTPPEHFSLLSDIYSVAPQYDSRYTYRVSVRVRSDPTSSSKKFSILHRQKAADRWSIVSAELQVNDSGQWVCAYMAPFGDIVAAYPLCTLE